MAVYTYKVVDKDGKNKKGKVEAVSEEQANSKLKNEGYTVVSVKPEGVLDKDIKIGGDKKVKSRDLSVFCKQFVSILNAGVTIISALEMMAETTTHPTMKKALYDTKTFVEKGGTLADGFRQHPKVFPPIMINMVAAGELSGSMEIAFQRLSTHFEKDDAIKGQVKKAMTYPIVICVVMIGVVVLMMTMVIPNFADMFKDMGAELPLPTRIMMSISDFMVGYWWLLIIIAVAIVFAYKMFGKTNTGKHLYSNIAIHAPLFGNLTIKSAASRFSRTLSTLMASGIPLMDAIESVAKMMGNVIIEEGLMNCKDQVSKGVPLSKPLNDMGVFPLLLPQMVKIGEETGNIEDMMEKVADYYDGEVQLATDQLTAMMEPMIICVMAVVVGGIVAAIYSPMLSMYSAIDNY